MIFTHEYVQTLFDMLEPLAEIKQEVQYHPEDDARNHSFQVLYHALRETIDTDLIIAALMHDVGKQVSRLGHDKESVAMMKDYASEKTLWLIEHHMRINTFLSGEMKRPNKAAELAEHPWFPKLVQLNRFDKLGRRAGWSFFITVPVLTDALNERAMKHFRQKPGLIKDFRALNMELLAQRSPKEAAKLIMQLEEQVEKMK